MPSGSDTALIAALLTFGGVCVNVFWSVLSHHQDAQDRIRIADQERAHATADAAAVQERLEERAAGLIAQQQAISQRTEALVKASERLERNLALNTNISRDAFNEANSVKSTIATALQNVASANPTQALETISEKLDTMQGLATSATDRAEAFADEQRTKGNLATISETNNDTNKRVRIIETDVQSSTQGEPTP